MRELRFQLGITNIYIERIGNIGCRLQLASRWLRGTAPVIEPQILVLCNAVTQAESRREIEGILGNVVPGIRAEEVTGFPFLVFEVDAHVEIHLGIDTPNGHFTAMGLVAAAGNVAVILVGQRHSERIEVDKKAIFIDIVGIGVGVAVVVEAMTDNKNRTAGDVRSYFTKFNGNLGETGCVGWMFDKKGCITFNKDDVDYEKLFEAAINLDAEDITEEEEEYKVYTSIPNLQPITEGLEAEGFKAVSAEFTRVPQNTIEVTDEKTAINIMRLLGKLEENDDVQNVYANFDIDDELMAKIENQI